MSETIRIIQPAVSNFHIAEGMRTRDLISRLTKLDSDEIKVPNFRIPEIESNSIFKKYSDLNSKYSGADF